MKKLSWSKHLLLTCGILFVAYACQCQKKADMPSNSSSGVEQTDQSCDDPEDETCSRSASDASIIEEDAAAAQVEESDSSAPVAEEAESPAEAPAVVISPELTTPEQNSCEPSETSLLNAPNLEPVNAVSENSVTSSAAQE